MQILRNVFILVATTLFNCSYGQTYLPVSARVDTNAQYQKDIYQLYRNYIFSRPDSAYKNPYWNPADYDIVENQGMAPDRSVVVVFRGGINPDTLFNFYQPVVMQIDSLSDSTYSLKVAIISRDRSDEELPHILPYLLHYPVKKEGNGQYFLCNRLSFDIEEWEVVKFGFITFYVHPACKFDKREAQSAVHFCEDIGRKFNQPLSPFSFYILPDMDAMANAHNMDYWTYYIGGYTNSKLREIFSTSGKSSDRHEFVHMVFSRKDGAYPPTLVQEGVATWLAGPRHNQSFQDARLAVSELLRNYSEISLNKLKDGTIRFPFNSNVMYVTGGVICKLTYEKKGTQGILDLYASNESTLNSVLEEIFEAPYAEIEKLIISELLMPTD